MALSYSQQPIDPHLSEEITDLVRHLPTLKHGKWIKRALEVLIRMADEDIDRLDWKILTASLEDLERGFQTFYPYRHTRKVTIFGSARILPSSTGYQLAVDFARRVTQLGFMVLTGAGGGIMQAGNEGAGRSHSFGLNIDLPFEQDANPYISGDPKLINFKYFFTRKLFFLRESDVVALFPGGFGTQDEAFETLTLCQTGKYGPAPLLLIDEPGADYWLTWQQQILDNLQVRGLISPEDTQLYTITDNLDVACDIIQNFYKIYHSSRYVGELFVIRLNQELTDEQVELLNENFSDLLVSGKIEKSKALPKENDPSIHLPRLVFHFNQRSFGRLYELINKINQCEASCFVEPHPEVK
ncbi:cytochrome D ubiquinol oxidase subunit II [Aphanothece hegewaldii CCALA 016]|uniref:Cytochrome D ubiquinol oxidase subunit II n=1 Tax=Aphanothece hegewaldii CCALA 016 TaxID=2107694 RepID=A0A2T1LRH8_9CHRO|nr:LOG family protein [Aphanothece hegewaldii]PSF31322.1 cytochrome D ubiquinol oxidase subunit II [Aphanothece hegewaldii CCALA 016]